MNNNSKIMNNIEGLNEKFLIELKKLPEKLNLIIDSEVKNENKDIGQIKIEFLGKNSLISKGLQLLRNINNHEEKIKIAKFINETKQQIEARLKEIEINSNINNQNQIKPKIAKEFLSPRKPKTFGTLHPNSSIIILLENFLKFHNFIRVPEINVDNEWNNFTGLNIEKNHPARQMHDTFYLKNHKVLLRSQTSNMQIRYMSNNKPPFKFYSYGRTYRKDSDRTHTPMFHQIEIVVVEQNINFANLKWFIIEMLKFIFGDNLEVRLRPSFFPFTQISMEADILINDKWLEILGCGIIHENVLKNVNIDSNEYQGFAIGIGIDRLSMIKNQILDLREMFQSDSAFIRKFNKSISEVI